MIMTKANGIGYVLAPKKHLQSLRQHAFACVPRVLTCPAKLGSFRQMSSRTERLKSMGLGDNDPGDRDMLVVGAIDRTIDCMAQCGYAARP